MQPVSGSGESATRVTRAQAAVKQLPGEADHWVALGEAWVQHAREVQSERLFGRVEDAAKKALSLKPGVRGGLRLQALVHRTAHRFEALQAVAQQLVDGDGTDPNGWALLGDAKLERGDYEGAAEAYQKLADLEPGIPAFTRVAWLRWLNGDVEGAQAMWGEAGKAAKGTTPENRAWIAAESGDLLWHLGRLDEALAVYEAALKFKPDHAGALFGRGRVKWAKGDVTGAIGDLQSSVKARRMEPVYGWLEALHREAGSAAEAEKIAGMLAGGEHDDPRSIALYLANQKKDAARAVALARADVAARGDVFAHDALAFALYRAGDAGALAHAEKALRLGTPMPEMMARAGLVKVANGQVEAGKALLRRALDQNPRFHPTLAAEARAALGPAAKLDPRQPAQFAQAWVTVLKSLKPDSQEAALKALEDNWQGRRYRWTGLALAGLCVNAQRQCAVSVWDHDLPGREALGGTVPVVKFTEAGWTALKTSPACKGQDRCVVTFEATLSSLDADFEKALRFEFSDGSVAASRAPLPTDKWFAKTAAAKKRGKVRTGKASPVKLDLVRRVF